MNKLKITTIGMIISVFLALTAVASIGSSFMTLSQVQQAGGAWQAFEAGPSSKGVQLNQVYKALGFGGMLHKYKDYLLVQEREQIIEFHVKLREIRVALDAYKAVGVNAREEQALFVILQVITAYGDALQRAEQMVNQGTLSDEIARTIIIDDQPAMAAIDVLVEEIDKLREGSATVVHTAVEKASFLSKASSIVIGVILMTLLGAMIWFTRWHLGASLKLIGESMCQLAKGDTDAKIPAQKRSDEIGEMARAVKVFKDGMIKSAEMAEVQRVETEQKEQRRVVLESLAGEFETSVGDVLSELAGMSSSLADTSNTMTTIVGETTRIASTITDSAEQASTNVQTVASASEELSSSISEISRQVAQSTQIAGDAVAEVDSANEKVQGLADAALKIGEVVSLITDIADQTNLLALNATIEAARAGDAGKGFAVVASEVKNLANQTARATDEISAQIGGIQGATQEAVTAIGSIGSTITRMNEIAAAIAAAIEEQGAATQEIARNVEMAAERTSTVSTDITDVSSSVDETGQAANEVHKAVSALSGQSTALRTVVDNFLTGVKAA